jgi:hypothetical protein
VAWGSVDATQFVITRGEISVVRSSPQVERGFCARCGATLTYQHASRSAEIDFTLVSLEDPESIAPASHNWVQDKLPWLTIDDDLPQHATTARS